LKELQEKLSAERLQLTEKKAELDALVVVHSEKVVRLEAELA